MTHRNRALLDLSREAPCCLQLGQPGCGSLPCSPAHSDLLRHGRGASHKSHDCMAVPGCPACTKIFTREHLGRAGYEEAWRMAHERYTVWLWQSGRVRVAKKMEKAA